MRSLLSAKSVLILLLAMAIGGGLGSILRRLPGGGGLGGLGRGNPIGTSGGNGIVQKIEGIFNKKPESSGSGPKKGSGNSDKQKGDAPPSSSEVLNLEQLKKCSLAGTVGPNLLPQPYDSAVRNYQTTVRVKGGGDALQNAVHNAKPGTLIEVEPGHYKGFIETVNGTVTQPIKIVGLQRPILDASGKPKVDATGSFLFQNDVVIEGGRSSIATVHFYGSSYVILENLTIRQGRPHGVYFDWGKNIYNSQCIVVRNLDIASHGSEDCLKFTGVDGYFAIHNQFHNCTSRISNQEGAAIDEVGPTQGVISNNHFYDLAGGQGIQAKGTASQILIQGNLFENSPGRMVRLGGSVDKETRAANWHSHQKAQCNFIKVVSNVFKNNGDFNGGSESSLLVFDNCQSCLVANNTIIKPGKQLVYSWNSSKDDVFANNIIYAQHNLEFLGDKDNVIMTHNAWLSPNNQSLGISGSDDIIGDATYQNFEADLSRGDYHLDNAPDGLMHTGLALADVSVDFDGEKYRQPNPSLGASECN